jgi:lysophospholipase L1-like esterase
MGVDAAPTVNPSYFLDQIHPNAAGHARLEPYFTSAMNAL